MKKRLNDLTNQENHGSTRSVAELLKSKKTTIHRVIKKALGKIKRKKTKVHALNTGQIKNRTANVKKIYDSHPEVGRDEFVITIYEALLWVDECKGMRSISYTRPGENLPRH